MSLFDFFRSRHRRELLAAFLEQGRREAEHQHTYRHDQRVHAIQQRLSRVWGKRKAFSPKVKAEIERELHKQGEK
jgi:hypothetical protein